MGLKPSKNGRLPVIEPVGNQTFRIELPLPLPDLKVVNAYVINGADGLTLIDPGWSTPESESALVGALHTIDCGISDIRRILVTHAHGDHYTQAAKWRDELGAELMLGSEERHTVSAVNEDTEVFPVQVELLATAGAADLADRVATITPEPYERNIAFGVPDRWLHDGDQIDCGGTWITVRATPGHTRGHVVFEDGDNAVAYTGDHLLPRITPSIGLERMPENFPLRSYLASLRLYLALPDQRMLPAHGPANSSTRACAQRLLDHHQHRLQSTASLVASGAATAFDIANQMRWTKRNCGLAELSTIHQMAAVLEILFHIDVLVAQGILEESESGVVREFRTSKSATG